MKAAGKMQASIDGAIIDFGHLAPNAVESLRARKHAAGPFEEKLQPRGILSAMSLPTACALRQRPPAA
jgi:hypothetical protein